MEPYETIRYYTGRYWAIHGNTGQFGGHCVLLDHKVAYRTIWDHKGPKWDSMGPYGTIRDQTGKYWTIWDQTGPCRTIWDHTRPYGTIRDDM